jgi:uncharacterized protein
MKGLFAFLGVVPVTVMMVASLAACSGSAPSRFYTLSPTAFDKPTQSVAASATKMVVGVGAVEIPDYLDRPQIVTRTSEHRLALAEFDLWGGSFKTDVNRVLLENLVNALPPDRFSVVALKYGVPFDCKVSLTIVRLDVEPGAGAILEAQWMLAGRDGKMNGQVRSTRLSEPAATNDIPGAVGAMSRAIGRLSDEIAAEIRTAAFGGQCNGK